MKKIIFALFFMLVIYIPNGFSQEIEIRSNIINVNYEENFFVIKNGSDKGIEMGDGLIVHRDGAKIAEAYIIEVRPTVSAAEILNIVKNEEIKEGDNILIVQIQGTREEPLEIWPSATIEKGESVSVNINTASKTVFAYSNLVLKEQGFIIINSNRSEGIILASKPLFLSLIDELWADVVATIDHNLVFSFDIKGEGDFSKLAAFAYKEHTQKQKYIKRTVEKDTLHYNELVEVLSKIKKRSED